MFIPSLNIFVLLALLAGAFMSVYKKKLSPMGGITGFICAMLIYTGAAYTGLCLLAAFFLLGTLATGWGKRKKARLNKKGDGSQRKASQVLANAGTATLMALLMLIFPAQTRPLLLMLAASLASATADTLSSELGMIYGKTGYNCLSWKREIPGLDGVISVEGTLLGTCGAVVMASLFALFQGFDLMFLLIVIAAMAGNFSDSVFGASLERRKLLNNDWVNFLSTFFAAGCGLLLYLIIKQLSC